MFLSVLRLSARLLARKVFLTYFMLIIINKWAPPPPIRDFNNNTYDCNEESGRSALIWQQIINKSAPPPEIRDHPLFAVVVSLICGGSLWAVVVVKFHRVINNTTWYYDQSYTIMTLCKHRLAVTCRDAQLHFCLYWSEKRQLRAKGTTKISPIRLFRKSWEFVPTGQTLKGDRKPELEFNNAMCNITELYLTKKVTRGKYKRNLWLYNT